jgi:alkaline phosphatase D
VSISSITADPSYEKGNGGDTIGRVPSHGTELASLRDYRDRYAQYRADVDLQGLHLQFPIIAIWDDHETADNGMSTSLECY